MTVSRQRATAAAVTAAAVLAAVVLVVSQVAVVSADDDTTTTTTTTTNNGGAPEGGETGGFGEDARTARRIPGGSVTRECDEMFGKGELEVIINEFFSTAAVEDKPSGSGPYTLLDVGRCHSQVVNGVITRAQATISDSVGVAYKVHVTLHTPAGSSVASKMVRIYDHHD